MIEIAVQELNKYYGSNHVLKGISFEINRGEKTGLIGKNGSGKTTLFKVISGMEGYESGSVIKASGRKIEVLEQIPVYVAGYTVGQVLNSAFEELFDKSEEMRRLEERIKRCNAGSDGDETGDMDIDKLLARYGSLQTEYEALGGYETESRIDKVCNGMKISNAMRGRLFDELSGGEKTRVNLARILLRDADILLLDEPTNHLDLGSIRWVEEFLRAYSGTVIVISHDRCFLDNVVTRIIEIDDGKPEFYEGNYSFYAEEKRRRLELRSEMYEQQQRKIGQLEAAAKRLHEWARNADNPAMHKRAFAIEKRIERMEHIERPKEVRKPAGEFRESGFSGTEMVVLDGVSKAYGAKTLFQSISLRILRNDRVALIGDNGCGKSTLIKLLTGCEAPDRGTVRIGSSVKMAYVPQLIEFDNPEATVLETVRYTLETNEEKARSILAAFHFRGKDILKKVGALSGGEKSRLKVCMLMQGDVNLLVLDEPTNHLDIPSREWIEEAVSQFQGTILFVSHDRYFINKFGERIWEMKDGNIIDYYGSFRDYCELRKANSTAADSGTQPGTHPGSCPVRNPAAHRMKQSGSNNGDLDAGRKQSAVVAQKAEMARQKRIMDYESRIEEAECRLKAIASEMEQFACDYNRLNSLFLEKAGLERTIDQLYAELFDL